MIRLLNDDTGSIITTELLLISSVLMAALLTSLNAFRSSVEGEFKQLGDMIHQTTPTQPVTTSDSVNPPVVTFQGSDLQYFKGKQ